ncbi:MAG TPA: T9SS type A sorting domain-containing protein, partial [bacterium]|nr:T9SS type A sorting domain-containing protein [bacterium]
TWSQVESGNNVFDVKWKPGDSATVYVTKGPDPFINTGADAGVKISTDGGLTFQTAGTGQPPAASVGKARLGVTPADPSVVYVNYADSNTFQSLGVYRSTDAGATWQPRNTTLGMMGSQGWYNLVLTVDRQDPDLLLTGGVGLYRSTDGGATFSQLSGQGVAPPFGDATRPHVDNHALAYEPGSDDAVWVCTDGGPWRSTDDGVTWQSRREGIVSYQFYDVCVAQTPTNFMVGGTQDNGIPRRKAGTWQETTLTTDGMVCNVDPLAPGTVYGESQNGNHRVSPNQGFSWSPINTGITGTGPWITAQDHDPTAQGRLFTTSSTGIFRTDSAGSLWTNVAPHTARWISISPANPDIVWTVSNFFGVWHTTDDGATWTQSVTFPATGGTEQKIHADPHDPAAAYVVFGSYTPGVTRIVRTRDLGATWEDVTGDFPDVPANTFVADPDRMNEWYVGSDLGIWLSTDEGQQWNPVGTGFPNCAVSDLEIKRPKRKLVAATYGRGVWEYDLPSTAVGAPEIGPVATRTLMLDPPFPNPAFRSTLLRFASRGEGEASLELFDVAGRRVSRIARIPRGDGVVRQLEWRPDDVSAGVYFVVLRAGDRRISRKLVVTR